MSTITIQKDELKRLVLEIMEEHRLSYWFGSEDVEVLLAEADDEPDTRTLAEILADVEKHRWTPPQGSPTPSQMLREDRDTHS